MQIHKNLMLLPVVPLHKDNLTNCSRRRSGRR